MQLSAKNTNSPSSLGQNSIWLINFKKKDFINSILSTIKDFRSPQKELLSALFQLDIILSHLQHNSLESGQFTDIITHLSKFMVTYRDDPEIIQNTVNSLKKLSLVFPPEKAVPIFLHLMQTDAHKESTASVEAKAFLFYTYVKNSDFKTWGSDPALIMNLIHQFVDSVLDIQDQLTQNINVTMFVHDILLIITSLAPSKLDIHSNAEQLSTGIHTSKFSAKLIWLR